MVDETMDISNKEQVVVAHEEFIGLYQIESTQSEMLLTVVHDVLHGLNISSSNLSGQCYDGAASMCGSQRGLATLIQKEEPMAVYTHCYGHSLSPACSYAIKSCKQ